MQSFSPLLAVADSKNDSEFRIGVCEMAIVPLIINLVTGAIGGNVAGAVLKNFSLGTLGNTICGFLGGGIGATILGLLGVTAANGAGTLEPMALVGSLASGTVGGGAVMAIVGFIKNMMAKAA